MLRRRINRDETQDKILAMRREGLIRLPTGKMHKAIIFDEVLTLSSLSCNDEVTLSPKFKLLFTCSVPTNQHQDLPEQR